MTKHARGSGGEAPEGAPSAEGAGAEPSGAPVADEEPDSTTAEVAEAAALSRAEVDALLAARDAAAQERHLRLAAEYQNYRRRVEREREAWSDEAVDAFARNLLPVLDSFERALAVRDRDPAAAASGLEAVDRQLRAALEKHGVTVVDPIGKPFDPRYHEAISRAPSRDVPPGTVTAVLEKGWVMRNRLLRAARVQVASAPDGE